MIPKWLHGKRIGIFDLETDFIPTTQIFCNGVSFLDIAEDGSYTYKPSKIYTQRWVLYSKGSLIESIIEINKCDYIAGHNIMKFDIPEVKKHLGLDLTPIPLDTLIISKLIFSKDELYSIDASLNLLDVIDWSRPYALDAFGKRLGDLKIEFKEFHELSEEMCVYCNQDVNLTRDLLLFLLHREGVPSEEVITLEHKAAKIIQEQTTLGFYFDVDEARALNTELLQEKGDIHRELSKTFLPKFLPDGKAASYKKLSTVRKYIPDSTYVDPWK